MAESVARFMLRKLRRQGVERIYGYPGDGVRGFSAAFAETAGIQLVEVRHHEMAAFSATAHAKLTGEPGICMVSSDPGAVHLSNGLYDARLSHQPVVALVGQRVDARPRAGQVIDLPSLFGDVAREFVQVCTEPAQAGNLIDRAVEIARSTRSPTCLIVPGDVQEAEYPSLPYDFALLPETGAGSRRRAGGRDAEAPAKTVDRRRVLQELSPRLPDRCIVTGGSASPGDGWAEHLRLRPGMKAAFSGTPATTDGAVSYAIGAKFAFPDRPVIAVVGGDEMQMNGINELITIQRYRERWADQTLVVLVVDDRADATSSKPPAFPYAEYAEMLGMTGVRVFDSEHVGEAWDEVLATGRPAVLEVFTEPAEPFAPGNPAAALRNLPPRESLLAYLQR